MLLKVCQQLNRNMFHASRWVSKLITRSKLWSFILFEKYWADPKNIFRHWMSELEYGSKSSLELLLLPLLFGSSWEFFCRRQSQDVSIWNFYADWIARDWSDSYYCLNLARTQNQQHMLWSVIKDKLTKFSSWLSFSGFRT